MLRRSIPAKALSLAVLLATFTSFAMPQQRLDRAQRDEAIEMLNTVSLDVKEQYYDKTLHGVDWNAVIRTAKENIANAPTVEAATSAVAAAMDALNDSHTFLLPPMYTMHADYGWLFQIIGNRCYVTQVKPGSDAEAKGVKPGDEVLTIDGFTPTREGFTKMNFALHVLSPQRVLQVVMRSPGSASARTLNLESKILRAEQHNNAFRNIAYLDYEENRELARPRVKDLGPDLFVIKFPNFIEPGFNIEGLVDQARDHKTLVVDLRGNSGGFSESLENWLGEFFDHDVKIASRITRNGKGKDFVAKSNRHHLFTGKLIVLADSESASAAELFSRVIQIEKRGVVLGDHTSGATMEAEHFSHVLGNWHVAGHQTHFGASITKADLIMTDGKSLEKTGVTPDELALPEPADLAAGRDPVLARAAELAGVKLSPEDAGKLFPYRWAVEHIYH